MKAASHVLISTYQVKSARQFLLASQASWSAPCELPPADGADAQPAVASKGLYRTFAHRRCPQYLASQADSCLAAEGATFDKDARSLPIEALQQVFSLHTVSHSSVRRAAALLLKEFQVPVNSGFSGLAALRRTECGNLPAHAARAIYFGSLRVGCQGNQSPSLLLRSAWFELTPRGTVSLRIGPREGVGSKETGFRGF